MLGGGISFFFFYSSYFSESFSYDTWSSKGVGLDEIMPNY